MVDLARFLPMKVFCCLPLYLGSMVLMALIILFRFIAMIIGCLYGPLLYLVLPLGGLYLAVDILLLYVIFGSVGLKTNKNVDEDGKFFFICKIAPKIIPKKPHKSPTNT